MFNRIPSDVSEIVVVYTRCYDVYREMKQIVEKFNDKRVKERIKDKLTVKKVNDYNTSYRLGDCSYRSYDKPIYVGVFANSMFYIYQWADSSDRCNKSGMAHSISFGGSRYYAKHAVNDKSYEETSGSFIYTFDNLVICQSGTRRFFDQSLNGYSII